MSKYIVATKAVQVTDMLSGKVLTQMPWAECIKALFSDPRLQKMMDIFSLIDLRTKLLSIGEGSPAIAISDEEGKALEVVCKRPETFLPIFLFSPGAEEFFRAFIEAPSKNPLNGAAKVEEPLDVLAAPTASP